MTDELPNRTREILASNDDGLDLPSGWRMAGRFLLLVFRLVLGATLLASAIPKLRYPFQFLDAVYGYRLVGPDGGLWVAVILPMVEAVTGTCLILGIVLVPSLIVVVFLAAVFVSAQLHVLRAGISTACGCFGETARGPALVDRQTLLRAWGLLLGAFIAILLQRLNMRFRRPNQRGRESFQ